MYGIFIFPAQYILPYNVFYCMVYLYSRPKCWNSVLHKKEKNAKNKFLVIYDPKTLLNSHGTVCELCNGDPWWEDAKSGQFCNGNMKKNKRKSLVRRCKIWSVLQHKYEIKVLMETSSQKCKIPTIL